MTTPIEKMIDNSVKCVKCGTKGYLKCDCWSECKTSNCTWLVEKGKKCKGCNKKLKPNQHKE